MGNSNTTPQPDPQSAGEHKQLQQEPTDDYLIDEDDDIEEKGSPPLPLIQSRATTANAPVRIVWRHGGKTVKIATSFNEWKQHLTMAQSKNGKEFYIDLEMAVGRHMVKFLVDERWRFDPELPTEIDQDGKLVNVVEAIAMDCNVKVEDLASQITDLPVHFNDSILNNRKLVEPESSTGYLPDFEDSEVLDKPNYVSINHVYFQEMENDTGPIVMGMTQRFMDKFVTTLYFKPRSSLAF